MQVSSQSDTFNAPGILHQPGPDFTEGSPPGLYRSGRNAVGFAGHLAAELQPCTQNQKILVALLAAVALPLFAPDVGMMT
jgi:hypothetical protein